MQSILSLEQIIRQKMGRDYWEEQNKETEDSAPKVVDCNGTELNDGDSVTLIKDLKVKGAGQTLKRGTLIKSIRTNPDNPEEIDCSTKQIKGLVLKTCFVKKG
jgi:protein PhnA